MNRLIIFLVFILLTSCSKDYLFNRDQYIISTKIKTIKQTDQFVRMCNTTLLENRFKLRSMLSEVDSMDNAGVNPEIIVKYDLSKIPPIEKQLEKLPSNKKEEYNYIKNSANKTMALVDSINAESLYKIIKKYGYPSFYNRKWKDTINERVGMTFLLTHIYPSSNSNICKKTLKIMLKEYFKGRVEEGEMKHFLWHIDGRQGNPNDYVIDKKRWRLNLKKL